MNATTKVGVLSIRALPLALPKLHGHYGGLETSAWLTVQALAQKQGIKASLLTRHETYQRVQHVNHVEILSDWKPVETTRESIAGNVILIKRFPWLRIIKFEPSLLWKVPLLAVARLFSRNRSHELRVNPFIQKHHFDAIYLFGVNLVSARAILSVQKQATQTVLLIQSNSDIDPRFAEEDDYVNEYGERSEVIRFAIANADKVVVQTDYQRKLLKHSFHRDSIIIPNPFDLESWDAQLDEEREPNLIEVDNYVLWVGRADKFHKRPLALLQIAARLPEINFVMVLNKGIPEVREEIEQKKTPNITVLDQVPFTKMPLLYKNSSMFAFTGTREHEGFPNVLLQAAATSKAIVSLDFLPEIIERSGGALISESIEKMTTEIHNLQNDEQRAKKLGQMGRDLMEKHPNLDQYADMLLNLLKPES